eukprot:XP_012810751.1 PREDICTED: uncharacterized protein LOC100498557 [Xenopus tropicalis]
MLNGSVPRAQRLANARVQMPEENDERSPPGIFQPSLLLLPISPLRSFQSIVELEISGPGALWSEDVCSKFQDLPDFTPAQMEALIGLLRWRQLGASANGNTLRVSQYLLMFQNQIEDRKELRHLAQKLKSLGRTDVVQAMHEQKDLLRWLGPVTPEGQLIKEMRISQWLQFTTALSVTNPTGKCHPAHSSTQAGGGGTTGHWRQSQDALLPRVTRAGCAGQVPTCAAGAPGGHCVITRSKD